MSTNSCIDVILEKERKKIDIKLEENPVDNENSTYDFDIKLIVNPFNSEEYSEPFKFGIEKIYVENISFEKDEFDKMGEVGSEIFGETFKDQNRSQVYQSLLNYVSIKDFEEEKTQKIYRPNGKDILRIYSGLSKIISVLSDKNIEITFENSLEKAEKIKNTYKFFK